MKNAFIQATSALALFVCATALSAQDGGRLSLQRILTTNDFAQAGVGPTRWIDDASYSAVTQTQGGNELTRVDAVTGATSPLVSAALLTPTGAASALDIEDYAWSNDHTRLLIFTNSERVWRANTRGDYWVLDMNTHRLQKLGGPAAKPSTLMFAKFSPDGKRVAYVRDHNLYVESLATGAVTPLTRDGSTTTINGTFDWVYEEELDQRDGFRWSPDGTHIAYWQLDAKGVRDFLLINNTDSLYPFTVPVQYPIAGTTNSAARIGVVSAAGGATVWAKIPGDPRNNYLARMDWADNSNEVLIEQLNRRQTTNTFWMVTAATGAARTLFVERDSAWIDIVDDYNRWGPGPEVHWTPDAKQFVYISERDGWRHAWMVARDGSMRLITHGDFDVMRVALIDMANGWLYYYASPDQPTRLALYRSRIDGTGSPERLTPADARGVHDYDLSPSGKLAIHSWSAWAIPPVYEIVRLPSHEVVRTLVDNKRLAANLASLMLGQSEFFRVDNGSGTMLDAWMIRPPDFDPSKKYPVLFYVYGEPWDQTVVDAYGGFTWLYHEMLAQQGYIVVSVDNRGTPAPRGRAWRKAPKNQFGELRVREFTAAANAIAQRPYVDASRMGIWGWSGGGSSTLMMMFRAPNVFSTGIAVAPMSDVRYYDTVYQERFLGLPATDSAAYHDASAADFAAGLKGNLLIIHGTGDDNVHYQATEKLVNRLIAAGKQFDMMAYPNRTHGIYEGPGTTMHVYTLMQRYLHEHLPAGGR